MRGALARPVEVERWVIGECILRMLGASRQQPLAREDEKALFVNECHPSAMVTILVNEDPGLTQGLFREIQRLIKNSRSVSQVNLEFADGLSLPDPISGLRGLEITFDSVHAYEGSTLPRGIQPIGLLPKESPGSAEALRRISSECVERIKQSKKEFTDEQVWDKLVPRVMDAFERHGLRESTQYRIAPHVPAMRVIAVAVKDPSLITAPMVSALQRLMLGKNPWEILVCDDDDDQKLVLTVTDGDALPSD